MPYQPLQESDIRIYAAQAAKTLVVIGIEVRKRYRVDEIIRIGRAGSGTAPGSVRIFDGDARTDVDGCFDKGIIGSNDLFLRKIYTEISTDLQPFSGIVIQVEPDRAPVKARALGNTLLVKSIAAGSLVSSPAASNPPATGSFSFFMAANSSPPKENCDMAISNTMASSL